MNANTMMKVLGYVPCDPEPGNGGGAAPTPTPTPTPTPEPTPTPTPEPKPGEGGERSLLDEGQDPKPEPRKEGSGSLLDDDPKPGEGGEQKPQPPTEEQVKAWTDGLKSIDLGDGVKWDDGALKEMTPALMEISGGDPKKAEGVVKAYTAYQQKIARATDEARVAFNNMLVGECEKRFGGDIKKVVEYARKGGAAIFGEKIWNAMKKVPSFANNPDILERLAEFGRRTSTDTGRVVPKDGAGDGDRGDVLHRMYGDVKV